MNDSKYTTNLIVFEVINVKGVQIDETDETLIQFLVLLIGKVSYDYDSEYGMPLLGL